MMHKIDLKKDLKHLYQASAREVTLVDVPEFTFLMIDGQGDPNTSTDYAQAVEALFAVSYAAKFMLKKRPSAIEYAVMPLEGLWWSDDMSAFTSGDKSRWLWTLMVMQPPFVDEAVLHAAIAEVARRKPSQALGRLHVERFAEGRCAQVLHVGPFSEEGPTIQRLHDFIDARSGRSGKHHEIYLSDVRRASPAKWKTIIRQAMR